MPVEKRFIRTYKKINFLSSAITCYDFGCGCEQILLVDIGPGDIYCDVSRGSSRLNFSSGLRFFGCDDLDFGRSVVFGLFAFGWRKLDSTTTAAEKKNRI